MNEAFAYVDWYFPTSARTPMDSFLAMFGAIFTLNQDLLLEYRYTDSRGLYLPGMEPATEPQGTSISEVKEWRPMDPIDTARITVASNCQPYFKLHGSSNWIDRRSGRPILVIGGHKPEIIKRFPILKWNYEQFNEYLSRADTRLIVIGYSFGDEHINVAIREAALKGSLKLFIIDPSGVDVLTKNPLAPPGYMFEKLQPHLIGASRRTLRETFGGGLVEYGKVMRFFD